MIYITFKPNTLEMEIQGHANHGKKGHDIVCSAVSSLFYTLGECLYQSLEMLAKAPTFIDKDGAGYLSCVPKEEFEGNIARSYWTILTGLQMLAEQYPQYVNLKVVEDKEK